MQKKIIHKKFKCIHTTSSIDLTIHFNFFTFFFLDVKMGIMFTRLSKTNVFSNINTLPKSGFGS